MRIRPMRREDLDFAAACTEAEGWDSEIRAQFEGFYAYDPAGCFVAEEGERRLGICVATAYQSCGFVGELIVVPQARGHGLGGRLLDTALEHLHARRALGIYLDGVVPAVPLYERHGFRKVCRSLRCAGRPEARATPSVRAMRADDLPAIETLDCEAFGQDRSFFLARRASLNPDLCFVEEVGGTMGGYLFGSRGRGGRVAAGPWYVRSASADPGALLRALAAAAPGQALTVGVLAANALAAGLMRSLGLAESNDPPWRMVRGPDAALGMAPELCAVGCAAKG